MNHIQEIDYHRIDNHDGTITVRNCYNGIVRIYNSDKEFENDYFCGKSAFIKRVEDTTKMAYEAEKFSDLTAKLIEDFLYGLYNDNHILVSATFDKSIEKPLRERMKGFKLKEAQVDFNEYDCDEPNYKTVYNLYTSGEMAYVDACDSCIFCSVRLILLQLLENGNINGLLVDHGDGFICYLDRDIILPYYSRWLNKRKEKARKEWRERVEGQITTARAIEIAMEHAKELSEKGVANFACYALADGWEITYGNDNCIVVCDDCDHFITLTGRYEDAIIKTPYNNAGSYMTEVEVDEYLKDEHSPELSGDEYYWNEWNESKGHNRSELSITIKQAIGKAISTAILKNVAIKKTFVQTPDGWFFEFKNKGNSKSGTDCLYFIALHGLQMEIIGRNSFYPDGKDEKHSIIDISQYINIHSVKTVD